MPSTTGHLKHIFLSQPAKGSLQLNTERSDTARQTPIRTSDKEQLGGGRKAGGERRGGVSRVPAQSPLPLATLAPHSPLAIEVRSGNYRAG